MAAREGVRSSARLSGTTGNAAPPEVQDPRAAEAERAATAALRRARAERAAERAREVEDSPQVLREKCRRLARALREAKHLVVYTGAGISTAADIPDYRGPKGVWTRLQRGETVGRVEVSRAKPTFTHMALSALWARGALKFVVSQNCDGLHVRAGLPRRALAELHGDMFAERCATCRRVYLRAFDTTERTARHAHSTRRLCHACGRELRDTIVHFGERGRAAWPLNWAGALRHAAAADVVLCLGSSLKVLRRYPRLWRMQSAPHTRPALFIVNLQWTPKDSSAALKINARCDTVMRLVARSLRLRVPRYRAARDPLLAHAEPLAAPEAHTTRRAVLTVPGPAPSAPPRPAPAAPARSSPRPVPSCPSPTRPTLACPSPDDDDTSYYSLSSPSASESDDELPLRCLADRLRVPPPLTSFQVSLQSGATTILLRAEHAPSEPPPPEPPPAPLPAPPHAPPHAPLHTPPHAPPRAPPHTLQPARAATAALRSFRIARPVPLNGHRPPPELNGRDIRVECPLPAKVKKEEDAPRNGSWDLGSQLKRLLELETRIENNEAFVAKEVKKEESDEEEANATLAAAIIRRAVLMCRAQLYPGLHTIITPTPAPSTVISPKPEAKAPPSSNDAECLWCLHRYKARRCLWYGPPRVTPPEKRTWRRERGRRYLCACCGEDGGEPARGADEGGWYGKGYRKGRRKRR